MTTFDHFSAEALSFLSQLKANNTREWFAAHKRTYEAEIKDPVSTFGAAMAAGLTELTQTAHDHKLYRIHRDVRFSKDKTPYNPHIHLSFSPTDATPNGPMWFVGFDSKKASFGCGIFQFDKPGLEGFRAEMAGARGEELMRLIKELGAKGIRIPDPELKRVPLGYAKDHPHASVLRRKGFSGWQDVMDPGFATQPELVSRCLVELAGLRPIHQFFRSLSEDV